MTTKKCSSCKLEKTINFFYKKEPNSDRFSNLCKECIKLRQRKYKPYIKPVDLPNEIWKDIPGYEGIYQVSTSERIKGLKRICYNPLKGESLLEERMLKSHIDKYGYHTFVLSKNKNKKTIKLHRIIATTFIPNPENKPCVNHINGIKTDNRVENLEWCSFSENTLHAFKIGLMKSSKGDECSWSKVSKEQVLEIRELKGKISQVNMAKKYGISITTISNIINRKSWTHI